MKKSEEVLLPLRFLATLCHFFLAIIVLYSIEENISAALPEVCTRLPGKCVESHDRLKRGLLAGFVIDIILLSFQFATLALGISAFVRLSTLFHIAVHTAVAICLVFFVVDQWHALLYWYLFGFLIVPPAIVELLFILRLFVLRTSNY